MFPFEFILVSSQIIQNQFSYSFPNSAQPAQATSTQPSRCLASFPSRPAYLPSPPLGPPSPSLGLGLPASRNRHHSGPAVRPNSATPSSPSSGRRPSHYLSAERRHHFQLPHTASWLPTYHCPHLSQVGAASITLLPPRLLSLKLVK
jgi:hypothetical protein